MLRFKWYRRYVGFCLVIDIVDHFTGDPIKRQLRNIKEDLRGK